MTGPEYGRGVKEFRIAFDWLLGYKLFYWLVNFLLASDFFFSCFDSLGRQHVVFPFLWSFLSLLATRSSLASCLLAPSLLASSSFGFVVSLSPLASGTLAL